MPHIRGKLALLAAAVAIAFGGAAASPATANGVGPATIAKPCSAGYVHAVLSWGHKCLRAGQFCKVGNRQYLRYGFYCPRSGHLRRR
jgi:hypothetical protein